MNRSEIAVLLTGALLSLAAAADNATAATAQVNRFYYKADAQSDVLAYYAGPGETNDLVLTREGSTVVATDRVPIAPGSGCISEATTVVRCSLSEQLFRSFDVSLSDGDDGFRGPHEIGGEVLGGPGDDDLVGSPARTTIFRGGPGDDRMVGGAESDYFVGEPGSDTMLGGGAAPSPLDRDVVDYSRRRAAVHADVAGDRDDGVAGERDRIGSDVETLYGGAGPDVLIGGPGRNALEGNDGRDKLVGGGGPDRLAGDPYVIAVRRSADLIVGGPGADGLQGGSGADRIAAGPGRDWVDAGAGADRLSLRDSSADAVECGRGRDVADQDGRDFLLRGCEVRGSRQPARAAPILWGDAGALVSLYMACPSGRVRTCDGLVTLELRTRDQHTPTGFSLAPGSVGFVYVPVEGRTSQNGEPSLRDAVLVVATNNAKGRVASRRIALRAVPDEAPLPGLGWAGYSRTGIPASRMRSLASRTL